MKTVRESLTNILLEVTNEMIYDIINETISKYRKKGKIFDKNQMKKRCSKFPRNIARFLFVTQSIIMR